jgi:hypothetical protein
MVGRRKNKSYKLLYSLALLLDNSGDKHHACDLYHKIIQIKPSFCKSYQMMAFIKKSIAEKKDFAEKCVRKDKDNIFAEFNLAMCESDPGLKMNKLVTIIEK